ncbi:hypothetical protein [Acetobacter fallax]|nr:hypothetical protein [Acetobacter fallax]
MTLDQGLFCVFHAPSQEAPSPNGLPGVRITLPPVLNDSVTISTFDQTGWLGGANNAALIRVSHGSAQVLVTVYQELNSQHEAPRLQVVRLSDAVSPGTAAATHATQLPVAAAPGVQATAATGTSQKPAEVAAHIQRRGDVGARLGEWMGQPGSRAWIEGFGISPDTLIGPEDIEYQAVLGKGWLSPWAEGGQYCGSRGMALPILGLRVRLKGDAAKKYNCEIEATFTDGTETGPVDDSGTAESESLAPLEAFRITITPAGRKRAVKQAADDLPEEELEEDLALLEVTEEAEEFEDIVAAPVKRSRAPKRPEKVSHAPKSSKPAGKTSPALSRALPVMKKSTPAKPAVPAKSSATSAKPGKATTARKGTRR